MQEVLEENHFLRGHKQYIINLNHVKQFNRTDDLMIVVDEEHISVARNQKTACYKNMAGFNLKQQKRLRVILKSFIYPYSFNSLMHLW